MKTINNIFQIILLLDCLSCVVKAVHLGEPVLPFRFAGNGIAIGIEYAHYNNENLIRGQADAFAQAGLPAMKPFPDGFAWGNMQSGPGEAIYWDDLDLAIHTLQEKGYTEILIALKSHNTWAQNSTNNPTPQKQYEQEYQNWIKQIVERYDNDGINDPEWLLRPITMYEIGTEFSSFEPEPTNDYIHMLQLAYTAAHEAYPDVQIAHAAFLSTPVDMNVADPNNLSLYDNAWNDAIANDNIHDMHHNLGDQRQVLDNHDIFDIINVHSLGHANEVEYLWNWIQAEQLSRGINKPVIISDTSPYPYIAWGRADICDNNALAGVMVPPAQQQDRCLISNFFQKLIAGDTNALNWARGYVAVDQVQKAVIAAACGYELINLAFTWDLDGGNPLIALWLALIFGGGAGLGQWGGAIKIASFTGQVQDRYPFYYALKQLADYLSDYSSVIRLNYEDDKVRVYQVERSGERLWIAWLDPQTFLLPESEVQSTKVFIDVGMSQATQVSVITTVGQTAEMEIAVPVQGTKAYVALTYIPVFVFPGQPQPPNQPPTEPPTPETPPFRFPCFSYQNIVEVKDKGSILMSELVVGDYVKDGLDSYSKVYSIAHLDHNTESTYLQIFVNDLEKPLEISDLHLVYVHDHSTPVRAKELHIGDILIGKESKHTVISIKDVTRNGVYAPLTESGRILVSGVLASNYAAILDINPGMQHWMTHAIASPVRIMCRHFSSICKHETYNASDGYNTIYGFIIRFAATLSQYNVRIQTSIIQFSLPIIATLFLLELLTDLRCITFIFGLIFCVVYQRWYFRKEKNHQLHEKEKLS